MVSKSKKKIKRTELVTSAAQTSRRFLGESCCGKMTNPCCLPFSQFHSELRDVVRVVSHCRSCPPEETAGHFLIFLTWPLKQEVNLLPCHSSAPVCLSVCLHSCTEQLYICLSTRSILVFICQKILHLYLQQLNRGQLSTCVVWWWVLEFDASRGGKAI